MDRFCNSVEASLKQENWYSAIMLALTLPDICGKLECPTKGVGGRYREWWEKYALSKYQSRVGADRLLHTFLSSADAYALRCACLHEGVDDITEQKAQDVLTRFHFVVPPDGATIHNNQIGTALQLQVNIFCQDICDGVRRWMKDVAGNVETQKRIQRLFLIYDMNGNSI